MYMLLILALKSILSTVIGSTFYKWFQSTKVGVWFQLKVNKFMEYLSTKYDIEITKKDAKWRQDYPLLADRVDKLESMAHPKCGLDGFDGYQPLVNRIEKLEQELKNVKKGKT